MGQLRHMQTWHARAPHQLSGISHKAGRHKVGQARGGTALVPEVLGEVKCSRQPGNRGAYGCWQAQS